MIERPCCRAWDVLTLACSLPPNSHVSAFSCGRIESDLVGFSRVLGGSRIHFGLFGFVLFRLNIGFFTKHCHHVFCNSLFGFVS